MKFIIYTDKFNYRQQDLKKLPSAVQLALADKLVPVPGEKGEYFYDPINSPAYTTINSMHLFEKVFKQTKFPIEISYLRVKDSEEDIFVMNIPNDVFVPTKKDKEEEI
jgi:hypothetical protein